MSEVNTDLTAKLGPLPAWAWGAIVVGGVLLFSWFRNRNAAPAPVTADATADPTATDMSGVDPSSEFSSNPYTQAVQDYLTGDPTNTAFPATDQGGLPAPLTNAQWAKAAANAIIGTGADPLAVESALADYINGSSLSAAEQSIVSQALGLLGSPPEGVLGVTAANPTTTPTTPVPVPTQPTTNPVPSTPSPTPNPVVIPVGTAPGSSLPSWAPAGSSLGKAAWGYYVIVPPGNRQYPGGLYTMGGREFAPFGATPTSTAPVGA